MIELFKPPYYKPREDCNGCGTGWSADLIPDTIYLLDIKECCCIHDYMYEVGTKIYHKQEADRVFLNNMLRVINNKKGWYFPHFLARYRAIEYYNAVVNFGGPAFFDNKPLSNS